jgi:hypothetical protein
LSSFHHYSLVYPEREIDQQYPDEDDRGAMQVIQDRHNGLNYIVFVIFSSYSLVYPETGIDRQYPDEDDRGAMQVIQDRHNGLNYILFIVFSSLLTCIPRKENLPTISRRGQQGSNAGHPRPAFKL